jgi:hypothetical protein
MNEKDAGRCVKKKGGTSTCVSDSFDVFILRGAVIRKSYALVYVQVLCPRFPAKFPGSMMRNEKAFPDRDPPALPILEFFRDTPLQLQITVSDYTRSLSVY